MSGPPVPAPAPPPESPARPALPPAAAVSDRASQKILGARDLNLSFCMGFEECRGSGWEGEGRAARPVRAAARSAASPALGSGPEAGPGHWRESSRLAFSILS